MLIIKGIIIGIGKIIPGVSGSILAISMGIYQQLIESLNNPIKNFKFLFKVSIGILISIILLSKLILNLLNNYYFITMMFFIGLIIGSIKPIKDKIKTKDKYLIYISFIIVLFLGLISINNKIIIINPIINFIYFILIGIIDSFTTIVPGISGTATLMMIGSYNDVMEMISNPIYNIDILIPFIIGFIIGSLLFVKLVNFLFKNYESKTYSLIFGISISTIFIMIINTIKSYYTIAYFIVGIIVLILGVIISKKITHRFDG